jgi:hypothetical protein
MAFFRHRVSGPGSAGDMWTVTMHSSSAAALSTVHAAWQTLVTGFIGTTLGAMWPNEVSATSVTTDQLDANGVHNVAQLSSAITAVGTGAGATLSPRSCLVIGLRTIVPTKAGRGRMYWPAPDASHLLGTGNLVPADTTAVAASFSSRLTTFKATSQPVVLHRGYDAHTSPGGILIPAKVSTSDNVVSVTVGVILGSQRRRTNRVQNAYAQNSI